MSQSPFLPILSPDPPRKSTVEKYGSLYFAALAGLAVCFGLVGVFALGVWSMRGVWADIYVVNDPRRTELDRVNAAWRLARDPRVTDRQKWDLAMSRTPPPLARYLLAESLTSKATAADPRGYARAIARSDGLPPFLLVLMARPLAYAAAGGSPLDREALREVETHSDPAVALWATYAVAVEDSASDSHAAIRRLDREAEGGEAYRDFARMLRKSVDLHPPARQEQLDAATLWLRGHDSHGSDTWARWREATGGIVPKS